MEDLESVCRAEYPKLVGAIGLFTGDRSLAEEIAQEALLRLCRQWEATPPDSPGAWLMRVAFNLARSAGRRRSAALRAYARVQSGRPAPAAFPDTADVLAVRAAVRDLPDRQRLAIVLRYFADLSVQETAQALDCPEGTVKTLTYQAIASLRAAGLEVTADD